MTLNKFLSGNVIVNKKITTSPTDTHEFSENMVLWIVSRLLILKTVITGIT
jgi:hypothetical protein